MQEGQDQQADWSFNPDEVATSSSASTPNPLVHKEVSWSASEFIDHHKSAGWYYMLFLGTGVLTGVIYLLTKDLISVIVIAVVGLLFAILAGRKPRQLPYRIDSKGITIGDKFYVFSAFKSFALLREGAVGCINLLPLKRFMPEISIYFPPEEENKIVEILADSLPNEQRKEQGVDKLMKRLRF